MQKPIAAHDDEVLNAIGKKGELMLPGYKLLTIWKDMYTVYGGELDWWHGAMGCFVFSNELWTPYLMFYDYNKYRSIMNLINSYCLRMLLFHGRK